MYSIEQLRELKKLREKLCIYNLENVKSTEEAKGAGLSEKPFLNGLHLSWNRENPNVAHAADADVLDGLHPHPNLIELKITGYGGASSVAWLSFLTNLEEIYLNACVAWEILPPLGQLPLLKRLNLTSMPAVREIGPDLYGSGQRIPFQCLEVMALTDLPNLAKWVWIWNDQCQNLPALLKLLITECPQLDFSLFPIYFNEKVTVHLENVESFEYFDLSESKLEIYKATNPKAWDVVSFQMLRTRPITSLYINSNPYPLLCDDLLNLVYLERLKIIKSAMFSLPNKESYNQIRAPLITLKELNLIECGITGEQLTWVLHHMPMLSHLNLGNCHKIKSIGVATFTASSVVELNKDEENLHVLELVSNYSSRLLCPLEIKQPINNACLHPPGLQKIRLVEMSELSSISLEGLTSFNELYLSDMGKLELLDVSSCVALKDLELVNCGRLASLKSLKSLIHLKHLRIECLPSFVDAWISASEEGSFRTLEYLSIDTFSFLAEPICRQLTSLLNLTINGDKDKVSMTEEQEEALLLLTSLKVIEFYSCQSLQVLPEKLHQLHTLEKLEIRFCQNIQSLPENGLPKSLRSLKVCFCGPEVRKLFAEYECGPEVKKYV